MSGPKLIVNLFNESSRIDEVMAGPWRDITVETVVLGQPLTLASVAEEHAGFVIDGEGTITSKDGTTFEIARDSAFAVPLDGEITLTASADGMRFLLVTMRLSSTN